MILKGTILDQFEETNLVILDRTTVKDGYGGIKTVWKDGAEFTGALIQPKDLASEIAKVETQKESYTLVTSTNITLKKDTYFKRSSDGKTFVVKFDNTNKRVPDSSTLQVRYTPVEEANPPID